MAVSRGSPEAAFPLSFSDRYSRFKEVGPKHLWGSASRFDIYQGMARDVVQIAALRGIGRAEVEKLKGALAQTLKVAIPGHQPLQQIWL